MIDLKAKIRIEPFGSIIYLQDSATTVELDKEETRRTLGYSEDFPESKKGIMAPKIVHLELTSRCNMDPRCHYCYASGDPKSELDTLTWKRVIKDLSKSGVLQVTFGGGEPTLRDDLYELAKYVKTKAKMNLGMTTNGIKIRPDDRLKWFDQINLSVHNNWDFIRWKSVIVRNYTNVGINFLCRKDEMYQFPDIVRHIHSMNAVTHNHHGKMELLLLAYKPVIGDIDQVIPNDEIMEKGNSVSRKIPVGVDGFTFDRCEGGYSFIDVSPTGDIYPCSFVREPSGNLTEKTLLELWDNIPAIDKCPYAPLQSQTHIHNGG